MVTATLYAVGNVASSVALVLVNKKVFAGGFHFPMSLSFFHFCFTMLWYQMLAMADRLLITEVDLEIADADAYFPDFSAQDWHRLGEQPLRAEDPACVMVEYLRKTPRNG